MKFWLGYVVLVFGLGVVSVGGAQEKKAEKFSQRISLGVDFGVRPGGFDRQVFYTNNGGLIRSGTDWMSGVPFGGTARFQESQKSNGWDLEARFRRQSIGDAIGWTQFEGQARLQNTDPSNAIQHFGGSYSAADIIQKIPVMRRTESHHISLGVVAGVSNVRSVMQTTTVILYPIQVYDTGTVSASFWGPKGGAKISYANKRFTVDSEATIGAFRENGTYTDVQAQYLNSAITYFPKYVIHGTTWSRETNWRTNLTVPLTPHFSARATYEKRANHTPDANYLLHSAPPGVGESESLNSSAVMAGFVFHL